MALSSNKLEIYPSLSKTIKTTYEFNTRTDSRTGSDSGIERGLSIKQQSEEFPNYLGYLESAINTRFQF